ncbi:MAG: 6-phospho-beta-glucosidase, partial [Gaiellaceae bacterium]
MKVAVVGGGSTYTPELIDGFIRLRTELPLTEITLIDPDAGRLDTVAGMAERMLKRAGH